MRPLKIMLCLLLPACAAVGRTEFETVLASYGNLTTVAGRGAATKDGVNDWQPAMEGGSALQAELSRPHATMADRWGNLYIADKCAHAIRKVWTDGTIHTIAGTGVAGYNGEGIATNAQLGDPNGLYTLPDGTTYIVEMSGDRVRRLATNGLISTVVYDPTNGPFRGIWVSPDESFLYYATSAGIVRKWTADGRVADYAAGFASLGNLDVDPRDGTLVVTDSSANRVYRLHADGSREVIAGNGTTGGGGDGFAAVATGLNKVRGVCFEPNGGFYVVTQDGNQAWYVDTQGIIHLLIDGAQSNATHGGDGLPLTAPGKKISQPRSVTLSPGGDLILTEHDGGFVRVVKRLPRILDVTVAPAGVALTWTSYPGGTSAVLTADSLGSTNWPVALNVPPCATDLVTSCTHTGGTAAARAFYRIARRP